MLFSCGLFRILHQPSPTAFASIHLTMDRHFDMDDLFSHIISDKNVNKRQSASYIRRTIDPRPFHQKTFLFVFRYFTIVDEGCKPAHWQRHSSRSSDREFTDYVHISECSSILGLSFEEQSFGHASLQRDGQEHFAPFHVLNIRCFPDELGSALDFDEKLCYSGPYAFLRCLNTEYKDAIDRFQRLNEHIAELALPNVRGSFSSPDPP